MNTATMQWVRNNYSTFVPSLNDLAKYNKSNNAYEFTFKTKDEYLVWRDNWRLAYRELSEAIRDHRHLSRSLTSAMAKRHNRLTGQGEQKPGKDDAYLVDLDKKASDALTRLKKAVGNRWGEASCIATILLEIRKASKIEAERQYQAKKAEQKEVVTA